MFWVEILLKLVVNYGRRSTSQSALCKIASVPCSGFGRIRWLSVAERAIHHARKLLSVYRYRIILSKWKEVGSAVRNQWRIEKKFCIPPKFGIVIKATIQPWAYDAVSKRWLIALICISIHWPTNPNEKTHGARGKSFTQKRNEFKAIGVSNYLIPFLQELETCHRCA